MLDTAFKEQLRQIFAGLEADYVFDIAVHPQHESRNELIELLEDTASCSDKISCTVRESEGLDYVYIGYHERALTGVITDYLTEKYPIAFSAGAITIYDLHADAID